MLTRILLLLLSAFFLSWSADYHIDLKQCGITTNCFVRESCTEGQNKKNNVLILLTTETLKNGDCDAIIQIRLYSRTKWHVMMQVNASDSPNDIDDSGVKLSQGAMQFACLKNKPDVNTQLFQIASQGRNSYEMKFVFCSFTIELIQGIKISNEFQVNPMFPTLEFTLGTLNSIKFSSPKEIFWEEKPKERCNPEMVTSTDNTQDNYLQTQIDPFHTFPPYFCEEPAFGLIYRVNSAPIVLQPGESLYCVGDAWRYESEIPEGEQFKFTCARKFCSLCAPLDSFLKPGCSIPTDGKNSDDCVTSTCPDNQWMLADGRILIGETECKQDEDSDRASAWYFKNGSVSEKVTKAACFDKTKACSAYIGASAKGNSKFDDVCVATSDWECTSREDSKDNTEITCPANYSMRWVPRSSTDKTEPERNATNITCHFPTGEFRDEKSNVIFGGSKVYCVRKKETSPSDAAVTDLSVMGGVAGGIALVGVIVALLVGGVVLYQKRKLPKKVPISTPIVEVKSTISDAPNVVHKKQQKKDGRGPWLKRMRDPPIMRPNESTLDRFDNAIFDRIFCEEFHRYSLEHRRTIIYNVTAFKMYAPKPKKKANEEGEEVVQEKAEFGNLYQFWRLFYVCEQKQIDCIDTWEMIFTVLKLLYERMQVKGYEYSNRDNTLKYRFETRMAQFAVPILEELGWKIKPGEARSDTKMRFFVVRVLYWINHKTTMQELKKMSKQFTEEGHKAVESPLRAIVWRFIVDEGEDQFDVLRASFWEDMMKDVVDDNEDFGTFRQHALYALASVKGNKKKEILAELYKMDEHEDRLFTPSDFYWAYLGALEIADDWMIVIKDFGSKTRKYMAPDTRDIQFAKKHGKRTQQVQDEKKQDWMTTSLRILYMILECCTCQEDYQFQVNNCVLDVYKFYSQEIIDASQDFTPILETRAINIDARFEDDAKNDLKELVEDFQRSFEKIEFDIFSRDVNPTIPNLLDKLRDRREYRENNGMDKENGEKVVTRFKKRELSRKEQEMKKNGEEKKVEEPKVATIDGAAKKIEEKNKAEGLKKEGEAKKKEGEKKVDGETMVEMDTKAQPAKKSDGRKVEGVKKAEEPKKESEKKVDGEKKMEGPRKIEESSWPGPRKEWDDDEDEGGIDIGPRCTGGRQKPKPKT